MVTIVYIDMHPKVSLFTLFFSISNVLQKCFVLARNYLNLEKWVRLWKQILESHPKLEEVSREEGGDFKTLCSISFATRVNIKFK